MEDEVLINLKLLASVGKHQKLITKDNFLNIERMGLVPECVRRWRNGEDRHTTIRKINEVIVTAISNETEAVNICLAAAIPGIENLKETYAACSQTCARLDTILDKINAVLKNKQEHICPLLNKSASGL
jgi:hypothetical protein